MASIEIAARSCHEAGYDEDSASAGCRGAVAVEVAPTGRPALAAGAAAALAGRSVGLRVADPQQPRLRPWRGHLAGTGRAPAAAARERMGRGRLSRSASRAARGAAGVKI